MIFSRVFVDANVLYSRTLRDWLALLQITSSGELYTVYWSEDVLAEAMYHLRRNHPEWPGGKIRMIHDRIVGTFEGGRVEDFVIDGTFTGNDYNDQHVHAAAIACQANFLLTADNGFRHLSLDADVLPYEIYQPDDFFILVDDNAPHVVDEVTRRQAEYFMERTGGNRVDLAGSLHAAGCPHFAERVRHRQTRLTFSGNPATLAATEETLADSTSRADAKLTQP